MDNLLFDWGNRDQASAELQRRLELEALYEQAVRIKMMSALSAAAASSSGNNYVENGYVENGYFE